MSKTTYGQTGLWRAIQSFLPPHLHFTPTHTPTEETWSHAGHQIHIDRFPSPSAKIKLIAFHGIGTNARQMSLILGRPVHEAGYEFLAPDMPGYGATIPNPSQTTTYADWIALGAALITHELDRDPRPLVLYGLSAGGMATYHIATLSLSPSIVGLIGMTFMDMSSQRTRDQVASNLLSSRLGFPLASLASRLPYLRSLSLPMWLVSRMSTLLNDATLLKICYLDSGSAGRWNSLAFLASQAEYVPKVRPEDFELCAVTLTQPTDDHWTPLWVSEGFLAKLGKLKERKEVEVVLLEGAGHYPVEEEGLRILAETVVRVLGRGVRVWEERGGEPGA
jgi:pimeloyl-ACP methyl ester carboxylesterase